MSKIVKSPWRKFRIGIHSEPIRTISKSVSECESIRKEFSISFVDNRLKINPIQSNTPIRMNSKPGRLTEKNEKEIMINGSSWREGKGAFFLWGAFQFGTREKMGAPREGEGCLLSLGCVPVWNVWKTGLLGRGLRCLLSCMF